ncbi:MAG: hypothetical protein B7Z80_06645 [Rhodospirillales bacterium 20-64-7]|nr:MAG: hypothetical protein B7Z80_06645 [Rhodospirillales bacterium 20-64-7]HQT77175.1 hypothetical protein [Rhodopila sp.]
MVQRCDGPIFIGPGTDTLRCACGNPLIEGYDEARFIAVTFECGQCGTLTTTPPLPEGMAPPFAVIVAEPVAEPRMQTTTLPGHVFIVGRAEMDRIVALYQPADPGNSIYHWTPELLDRIAAAYQRHTGTPLPAVSVDLDKPFSGVTEHALGWAVAHLRQRMALPAWSCADRHDTSSAAVHAAGFMHFLATWSHHPLFPAMLATAADGGFSMHALAPFAAAHCLSVQGNRIIFPTPAGFPGRIDGFSLAPGPTDLVAVRTVVFDRFEYPFGRPWDAAMLQGAVADVMTAEQGRINLKNPGLLLLSPGTAMPAFDAELIRAVQAAMSTLGRKNRGLVAAGPIILRMQALPDPHAIRFGYGLFPIPNRHYQGDIVLQPASGGQPSYGQPSYSQS